MKIEAPNRQLMTPEVTKVKKGVRAAAVEQPQDQTMKVQLTDQVKILSNRALVADVGELQGAQEAKVAAVRARVLQGDYQVSGRDLAEKMLSRSDRN